MATPALAPPGSRGRRRSVAASRLEAWGPAALAALAAASAVSIRVWFLLTPQAFPNGDEAVTGLMVGRILHGHLYAFFAGQSYNGALNQYLQALMYVVLPLPMDAFTLRLVMVAEAAVDCWLIYLIGKRMLASRWHAALAALLFALGPYWNVWYGVRSYGSNYAGALVVALAGLYCALRVTGDRGGSPWWSAGFGLCCGLAVWLGFTGAYLLVPAGVWLLAAAVRSRTVVPAAVGGFVVGSAPVTIWMALNRHLVSLGGPQPFTTVAQRWHRLSGPIVREWLGLGYVNDVGGWSPHLRSAAVAALALAWVVAVVVRRRGLLDLLTLRASHRGPIDVLLLAVPVVVAFFVSSRYAWGVGAPRYLFVAYPILALGLAALVPRRPALGAPAALAITAGLAGTSMAMLSHHTGSARAPAPSQLEATADYLAGHHEGHVYSDYWTGMPLQYVAGDGLTVAVMGAGSDRVPERDRDVDHASKWVYVASTGSNNSLTATRRALDAHHVRYHEARVGLIYVFDHLHPLLRPWQLGLAPPPTRSAAR
ncbi:MAG: hypothetical protein ACRD0J_09820 [Acidimicrobiales bacterium]